MKKLLTLLPLMLAVAGCAWLGIGPQPIPVYYAEDETTPDSAYTAYCSGDSSSLLAMRDAQIMELLHVIDSLYFQVDSLRAALDISNSRITVIDGFVIPDSIVFANRTFNLRNDRVRALFEEIFSQELKSAHRWIPRSGMYFPLFDSVFVEMGVPVDAKYLAIAESSLNSEAASWVGAGGIWQFMPGTAKLYNLRVDNYVDERRNIFKSTRAAGQYLIDARQRLATLGADDWLLAMCAYNAGAGSIEKAIKAQGGYDFFDLIMRVDETNRYVWRAVAIKMIFEHEDELFGERFERDPSLLVTARLVPVSLKGHYKIDDWAQAQGTTVSSVWHLNPWIKMNQQRRSGGYSAVNNVILPPGDFEVLVPVEAAADTTSLAGIEKKFQVKNEPVYSYHTVKRGESLSGIAHKYHTTVAKIKALNGLHTDIIKPGQKLRVSGEASADSGETVSSGSSSSSRASSKVYVVRNGDTIDTIARKLHVTRQHLVDLNHLVTHDLRGKKIVIIQPGQKLKY